MLLLGSMKQKGWMRSVCSGDGSGRNGAVGQEGLWSNSKESFPDFINLRLHSYPECKTLLNGQLAWDFSLWIPFFSFYSHSPIFFLFSIFFSTTALAELQRLSFFIGLLTLQTALQHSWVRIMPPPHLCVYGTPYPSKSLKPFTKTSLEHPHLCVTSFLFCI